MSDFSYGKSVVKTLLFGGDSAEVGAASALPSFSLEAISLAAYSSGAGGLIVGGIVIGGLALFKQDPHVNLRVVLPMLYFASQLGQKYFSEEEIELAESFPSLT